jgi:hypothetical protein
METMRFYLCTGFSKSKTSHGYGGTHEEWLAGYGQGNVAAGPGFTAMSLLIVNAYLRDGFGAPIYSSYYKATPPLSGCDVHRQHRFYPLGWLTHL